MPWYPFKLTGRIRVEDEDDATPMVDKICTESGRIHVLRIEGPDDVQMSVAETVGCPQGRYMTRQGEK